MEKESSAKPNRTKLRFSLMTVFMVMSCVCCYLAGESNGFRKKITVTSTSRESVISAFKFEEVATSSISDVEKEKFLSTMATTIKKKVMRSVWRSSRHFGIYPDIGTSSLVVVADPKVLGAVKGFLEDFDTLTLLDE